MNRNANTDMSGLAPLTGFAQIIEASVLARAQRGDMRAFATLYARFGQPCYGLALRLTGNTAQAEDLVQEVFLKLIETIRSYRGDAPFGAWLKRMTANAAIDQLRRNKRFVDADPEAMFAAADAIEANPAQKLDAAALLQRLPTRARAIVVLHELEGYTHTEIARLFGQSESYSKSILARGLQRLHASVAESQAET
ncbi:RNA polymerase sigma factor [Rudaea sp.]|uniref:RNA polymerase sigma factor n=1 Tax=Rudaea sp. TaxID=2136325 RepID=UPI002ED48161